jgi:hypothetical protein
VELARSEIHPHAVNNLSDEELILRISAAVRDASQVVPEAISMVAHAGSAEDSGISSLSTHQAEVNYAVELENRSVGTFSTVTGAQSASEDNVVAAKLLLAAEMVSTSSSGVNPPRGESHALSQQQPPQSEDQTDETDDEHKQPAKKKPRV